MAATERDDDPDKVLATALAASSSRLWQHYRVVQQFEPLLSAAMSKQRAHSDCEDCKYEDGGAQPTDTGDTSSVDVVASSTEPQHPAAMTCGAGDMEGSELDPTSNAGDAAPLQHVCLVSEAEDIVIETEENESNCLGSKPFPNEAASVELPGSASPSTSLEHSLSYSYLAESLVSELCVQQALVRSCRAEALYIEAVHLKQRRLVVSPLPTGAETAPAIAVVSSEGEVGLKSADLEALSIEVPSSAECYIAKSLVGQLGAQQAVVNGCKAETRYVETVSSFEKDGSEGALVLPQFVEEQGFIGGTESLELAGFDEEQIQTSEPLVECDMGTLELVTTVDAHCQTTVIESTEVSTETQPIESHSESTNTDSTPLKDSQTNTDLSCFDLLRRAQEMQELQFLKADLIVLQRQLNDEKSKRMVAEQLSYIVQSDLDSLRGSNITETTTRLRLENELCDVKAELSHAQRRNAEKEQRIKELEESLTGSSVLIRKLEEQNSVSLFNRGGIDYMLQAKLAEGRAQEAEQKLEVLQTELLQSQGEVRRLLDRVGVASRERAEMVSSKVHTQLLQIADDRTTEAESRARQLEREVAQLKDKLAASKPDTGPTTISGSYPLPFGLLPSSSSSTGLPTLPTLPFSYSSGLPPLEGVYPLSSSSLGLQLDAKAPPGFYGSSFPSLYSNGSRHGVVTTTTSPLIGGFEPTNRMPTFSSSHDAGGFKPSSLRDKKKPSSEVQDTFTDSSQGGLGLDLPSFDATSSLKPIAATSPTKMKVTFGGTEVAGESDSSDWSSSEEEEGEEEGEEPGPSPLKPSVHASLIAQWEWRSTHEQHHDEDSGLAAVQVPPASPAIKRRPPPPVAPKPAHLTGGGGGGGRGSRDRTPPIWRGGATTVTSEPPSSFDDETRAPLLKSVTLARPRGPKGRCLPSRYRAVQQQQRTSWLS